MTIRERLADWLGKAATRVVERRLPWFPEWQSTSFPVMTFSRAADEGYRKNSAVFACLNFWADSFGEPELHVYSMQDDDKVKVPGHPLRELLRYPNEFMGENELLETTVTYALIGGIAYWWKERTGSRKVIGLWPLHDGHVTPIPDPVGYLSHYEYSVDGGEPIYLAREDVVPFRWRLDPLNPLRGLSPIVAAARSIDMDSEAQRYQYALLKNDAVPRTMLIVNSSLTDDAFKRMSEQFRERYGGERRGDVAIVEGQEGRIERLGANLEELAAESLHNIPESRIAAAFGIPAVMVGLNVGLQRAIQGAPRELQEFWTETVRVPRWRRFASQVEMGLLRDFDSSVTSSVEFDLSEVRALVEDQDSRRSRVRADVLAGHVLVNEARTEIGLPEVDGGDVFLRQPSYVEIPLEGVVSSSAEGKAFTIGQRRKRQEQIEREFERAIERELSRANETAALNATRNGKG